MSMQLEMLEKAASQKTVNDLVQIADLMSWFLNTEFKSLVPERADQKGYIKLIIKELSSGYDVSQEEIGKSSVGEVLAMIAHENENEYFMLPVDTDSRIVGKISPSAGHCYYLNGAMYLLGQKSVRLKQFLSIDFFSLTGFLKTALEADRRLGVISQDDYEREMSRLLLSRELTVSFMEEFGPEPSGLGMGFTLKDLTDLAYKVGNRPWLCNVIPLDRFCSNTMMAFRAVEILFMDMIYGVMVKKKDG